MGARPRRLATLLALTSPVAAPVAAPVWAPLWAQAGDVPGEEQPALREHLRLPPPPPLSPEEEHATFVLPEGVRAELVAAEPLVGDPVTMAFDGEGRLWVAEMRGYMPDVDATGEDAPVGAIAVLRDTDGDGRMDERTVFLDGLVLPRAVLPTRGGALVIAPPELFLARDTDGDGVADEREVLATGLPGVASPEHAINGLLPGLDNWIRNANDARAWRWTPDGWSTRRTAGGGQWGIAHDDDGRVFYDTNWQSLFADLYPSHYAVRNPHLGRARGVLQRVVHDETVRPAGPTPGVNRGYRDGVLRPDGSLAQFTAACAPFVHRGDALAAYRGDAFVCEPAGNLVKRFVLVGDGAGGLRGEDPRDEGEFWTSTDERFRPVALANGPDGALYVADMYRGVIQHRVFVTSFLRRQVEERRLERPIGRGRIWRLTDREHVQPPPLSERSWTEVAALLAHPNGWWRDLAQRTIVEEGLGDPDALETAAEVARAHPDPLARVHALWALEGAGGLELELVEAALAHDDPRVARTGMRLAEGFLAREKARLVPALERAARHGPRARWQAAHTLGETLGDEARAAMLRLLEEHAGDAVLRDAVLSGLAGEELAFLARVLEAGDWREERPGRPELLAALARCVGVERRGDRIAEVVAFAAASRTEWQARALLAGLLAARPAGPDGAPAPLSVPAEPRGLEELARASGEAVAVPAAELLGSLLWPGRTDLEVAVVAPLDAEARARFERGRELYADLCARCHQPSGLGEPGKAPPLRGTPWVLGDAADLVRVVRWGLVGPIEVNGERWEGEMPAWSASDEDVAAVLTYLRREWGNGAAPLSPADVRAAIEATPARTGPFSADELGPR